MYFYFTFINIEEICKVNSDIYDEFIILTRKKNVFNTFQIGII